MSVSLNNNIDELSEVHPLMRVYRNRISNWLHYWTYMRFLSHFSTTRKSNLPDLLLPACFLPLCTSIFLTRKNPPQLVIITTLQICNCYSLWVLIDSDTPFCSAKILSEYQVHCQLWNLTGTAYACTPTFCTGQVLILMETHVNKVNKSHSSVIISQHFMTFKNVDWKHGSIYPPVL